MIGEIYSGYLDVAILIWLFSGLFNLFIDTNKYRQSNMTKEKRYPACWAGSTSES